jgi:2-isopropylmalate synthase
VRDEDIWRLFKDEYLPVEEGGSTAAAGAVADKADSSLSQWGRLKLLKVSVSSGEDGSDTVLKARVLDRGLTGHDAPEERQIEGTGNGPVAAFLNALSALDLTISVEDYVEHAMTAGSDALAASYVGMQGWRTGAGTCDLGSRHRFLGNHQHLEGDYLRSEPF